MARILVVDDDSALSANLEVFLKVENHKVDLAADGPAGFSLLTSNSYQLAILDWDMPGMSGPEICQRFRDGGGQTPILLLTGRTREEEKEAGLDAGADDYLTKPFSLKLLGVGAWGEVCRATDLRDGTRAAVKILHAHLSADPIKIQRFNREAEALLRLEHPGFGESLSAEHGGKRSPVPGHGVSGSAEPGAVPVTRKTVATTRSGGSVPAGLPRPGSRACKAAYPSRSKAEQRLSCTEQGTIQPKVLDFGLAKMKATEGGAMDSLTQSGEVLGTPACMSPEQCLREPLDARSDLYALGCLVYEAISGQRAIPGKTVFEAMSNQIHKMPAPFEDVCPEISVPAALCQT